MRGVDLSVVEVAPAKECSKFVQIEKGLEKPQRDEKDPAFQP